MQVDPSVNVVVFELRARDGTREVVAEGPTRADDCIQQAWARVRQKEGVRPEEVRKVFSEWGPSDQDRTFLHATFPADVQVGFSFRRPPEDGWDQALKEAEETIRRCAAQKAAEEALASPAGDVVPVLRDLDEFTELVVHRPIGPGLAAFLAHVAWTPRQTLGIDYLLKAQVEGSSLDGLFRAAHDNFMSGLDIEDSTADGEKVFRVRHALDLGTSALALSDFYTNASGWTGSDELFVGFTNPGTLYVTARVDGPFALRMREAVQASDYWGSVALTPACYALDQHGLRSLVARAHPPGEKGPASSRAGVGFSG